MDQEYNVLKNINANLKKIPVPLIDELVLIGGVYYRVLRVVHDFDGQNVTWCFVEKLIEDE